MKRISYIVAGMVSMGTAVASPWPVGIADEATAIQREPTNISVIGNDIGDNLYISSVNAWSRNAGRIVINDDKKSVTYTSGDATSDEFWYVLKDDQGRTNAAKVTVSISTGDSPVGGWPSASGDSAEATYGEAITIPVLDNDSGTDLKLVSVNEWSTNKGKISISSDNEVTYRQYGDPRGDQIDTFWYVFEDKWGRKNAAKVTVSIKEAQSSAWPTGTTDSTEATSGESKLIQVLANDVGTGLVLTTTNEWTRKGGKSAIENGAIRYTPPSDFTGEDSFWYVFKDNQGRTNSAKVIIDVAAVQGNSVVEYCGNTYETDGTLENTSITSLTAPPSSNQPTALGASDFEDGQGEIGGRRYYVEGTAEVDQSLMMEVDGVTSSVVEAITGQTVRIVGAHLDTLFYVKDDVMFAHNGNVSKRLGHLFDDLGYFSDAEQGDIVNYVGKINGLSDDFFFSVTNLKGDASIFATYYKTYWRISGGFEGTPVKIVDKRYTTGSGITPTYTTDYSDFYSFEERDYVVVRSANFTSPNVTSSTGLYQYENGIRTGSAGSPLDQYIENAGRLFIIMKPSRHLEYLNSFDIPGRLNVIDGESGELVTIATCDIGLNG